MKPEFITFTGIDDRTDLHVANQLAQDYPIEWGVLFSRTNRDARFPSQQTVKELNLVAGKKSAHICGEWSTAIKQKGFVDEQIPLKLFDRAQLNGRRWFSERLGILEAQYNIKMIVQTEAATFGEEGTLQLFDVSGGRGHVPGYIPPHPGGDRLVGYAGGMGPRTVMGYLKRIKEGPFWIDMEQNVRSYGWFDLNKVRDVCEMVYG